MTKILIVVYTIQIGLVISYVLDGIEEYYLSVRDIEVPYKEICLASRIATLLTEFPINIAQLLFFIVFLKSQYKLLKCSSISIAFIIITIYALNTLDTVALSITQIINYRNLIQKQPFYLAWKSITELFEDFVILVNTIAYLVLCLLVYKQKYQTFEE